MSGLRRCPKRELPHGGNPLGPTLNSLLVPDGASEPARLQNEYRRVRSPQGRPLSNAPFVQQPGFLASNEEAPGQHRDGALSGGLVQKQSASLTKRRRGSITSSPYRGIGSTAERRPAKPETPERHRDAAPFSFHRLPVAQWIRAPGFEPGGCGFESRREHHLSARVAQEQRCRSQKPEVGGANPSAGIFFNSSVAETEMHSSRKGDHAGATPAGGTVFNGASNRTSVSASPAKRSVPPRAGWGASPRGSAISLSPSSMQ